MPIELIPLSGGLVTSKDPSLLAKGELTRADDAEYLPNDPGIWKVKGRSAFNSSPEASSVLGGRYLEFEGGTDLIVTAVGTTYRQATAGLTGSFTDLVTGLTGGSTLDSVHYNNAHFLLNGVDRNRAIASDGTASLHGMLANASAPTVSRDAGAGTGFTLTSGNTVEYWVEERVKSGSTITKRNAATTSEVLTFTGDGTLDKPVITRPTAVNSDATHWALYGTGANVSFPTGFEISEVAIATTTIEDTRTGTDPGAPTGEAYEVVQITLAGATVNIAKNGPPPISDTGDVLEDQIILNDTGDRSLAKFSFYDAPHAFPSVNVIRFETKEADEVRLIKRLGGIVIAGLRDSMWRILTLPNPEDAAFQPGRVKEQIEGAHGVMGPKAACLFSFGQGLRMAYVSRYGIHVTDGYSWDDLADDLDWDATVDVASLSAAVLINNPLRYRLEFYYRPSGGSSNTKALYLCYHPSQAKSGVGGGFRAKITGPINVSANDAFTAIVSSETKVFTCKADGVVYLEGGADTDASSVGNPAMVVRTGQIYLNGIGMEGRVKEVWLHHSAGASGQTATVKVIQHSAGKGDETSPRPISLERREATSVAPSIRGEAFQFGVENSDALGVFRTNYFAAEVEEHGTA